MCLPGNMTKNERVKYSPLPNGSGDKDKPFTGSKIITKKKFKDHFTILSYRKSACQTPIYLRSRRSWKSEEKDLANNISYWPEKFSSWVNARDLHDLIHSPWNLLCVFSIYKFKSGANITRHALLYRNMKFQLFGDKIPNMFEMLNAFKL